MPGILVLHGPNLNMLGVREPQHYGHTSLSKINKDLAVQAKQVGLTLETLQSNAEHTLIERIQATHDSDIQFIIINPAGFTHTSVALRDALSAVTIPFIEIHLSNIHRRETFRQHSYFSDIAVGVISGLGPQGYGLALQAATAYINQADTVNDTDGN
ncbi:MAG: type II 3-dehydroquinate dehydratase [Gammaproteobacteria bacterium]|nr:type II 3-dehydroquinate dehydratase [Gammaproteobacteria bacterium]